MTEQTNTDPANSAEILTPQPKLDPLAETKAKLSDVEKENFFKSFLSDKPYVADENLFKGKIPVKFSTLTVRENNVILLQMQFDRESGVAKNNDKYLIQVIQYRIAASLLELDHKPFAKDVTENTFPSDPAAHTTYILKRLELMDSWGVFKISALTEAFNRFEKKVRALTEESFTESF